MENGRKIEITRLKEFCRNIFIKLGMENNDARISSDVLVAADIRGTASHGVGRLRRYVKGLQQKQMLPDAEGQILVSTPVSVVFDARGGMGAPASLKTMKMIIEKAMENGSAFGCVKNSNHFGIAAYYAMMALEYDMIGIAMTNTAALGVPTFGRQVMFGTNPLAFCAPAKREKAFVLDMSTTVVSRGKIEVYNRKKEALPENWAVDKNGLPASDAETILDDMFHRRGGGILPLGGAGEFYGGHKGYGLAIMVDILCSVLCGAPFGPDISDTAESSARVTHFFGAMKISNFTDPASFRNDMDKMLEQLRNTPAAKGSECVYFAGQKEFENEQKALKEGLTLPDKLIDDLNSIAEELKLAPLYSGVLT